MDYKRKCIEYTSRNGKSYKQHDEISLKTNYLLQKFQKCQILIVSTWPRSPGISYVCLTFALWMLALLRLTNK